MMTEDWMIDMTITKMALLLYLFPSRRRHARFDCDWSSDVCPPDLAAGDGAADEDDAEHDVRRRPPVVPPATALAGTTARQRGVRPAVTGGRVNLGRGLGGDRLGRG